VGVVGRGRLVVRAAVVAALIAACGQTARTPSALDRPTIQLPSPSSSGSLSLEQTLARRESVREFSDQPLTLAEVGQLLWAAQGVTREWGGRTAPSAGALYPLRIYVALPDRVLRYVPKGHRAEIWRTGDRRALVARSSSSPDVVSAAAAVVVIAGDESVTRIKYGDRAARYVTLEAGHATQNLLLEATTLGLAAVPMGAFDDRAVARGVPLRAGESAYYIVPVGHPRASG
jgi:SagB-type dehydrogenase family enzyme